MTTKDQIAIAELYLEYNLDQNNQPPKDSSDDSSFRYRKVQKICDMIETIIDELIGLGVTQKVTFIGEDFLSALKNELDYKIGPEEYQNFLNKNPEIKKKYEEIDDNDDDD